MTLLPRAANHASVVLTQSAMHARDIPRFGKVNRQTRQHD